MKRVLILSDSLALPRQQPEMCLYEETYPVLLRLKYEVHQVSIGGATSDVLLKQVNYHKTFNPDIVILQVGIVDCAPRFMTRLELDLANKLGIIGKMLIKLLNKKWIKKTRKISYVNINKFRKNLQSIKQEFSCPVIAIQIIPAVDEYENNLPGVKENITKYNKEISLNFENIIDVQDLMLRGVMSDFHHLNHEGHLYLFNKIETIFKQVQKLT